MFFFFFKVYIQYTLYSHIFLFFSIKEMKTIKSKTKMERKKKKLTFIYNYSIIVEKCYLIIGLDFGKKNSI